jgi:glycogen debranching enzyme
MQIIAQPPTAPGTQAPPSFAVTASVSLQTRRLRTLKHEDTFAVLNAAGDIAHASEAEGLYHRDTRHLSYFAVGINGTRPLLLSSMVRDDNSALTCEFSNPEIRDETQVQLEQDIIHLSRAEFIWQGVFYQRIAVRNFSNSRKRLKLNFAFAADFVDLFEVRGIHRSARGHFHPPVISSSYVQLAYTGLDNQTRSTQICFDPQPSRIDTNHAEFALDLEERGYSVIHVAVRCNESGGRRRPSSAFLSGLRASRNALHQAASKAVSIETSNDIYNEAARRAIADLYMLMTHMPEGLVPYAGIPWYSTVFGRDSLITALLMLWLDPGVALGVLRYLAANQATDVIPEADAEPGKILHEVRLGEMAELGEVPFRRYYGSVDSTPLFVFLAGSYLERTDDLETIRKLWPHIEAALNWIDQFGDQDGDGFVEYGAKTKKGLVNQGWKDSYDAIFHANGDLAKGPIALVEVQGYVFAAKKKAAIMAERLGHQALAAKLLREAEELQKRFQKEFWSDELGTYALALDGKKRPCLVQTSNAGHALFTGIAADECVPKVVQVLMSRESFSGWGIRTVATTATRYNPMSYHNGSVWPHDNALIAMGFAHYGFKEAVSRIFESLFAASTYLELRRLPELFCGFGRRRSHGPTLYPVACAPQAWAAAAPLALLQSCLGLRISPKQGTISLEHPMLPPFLDHVTLRKLACGGIKLDIEFRRAGDHVAMNVLNATGDAQLKMTV